MMHSSPRPNGKSGRALQAPGGACRARQNFPGALRSDGAMRRWTLFAAATALALTLGCTTLDERQRAWIFQPSDRAWGSTAELARDMDDVWVEFESKVTGEPARLHGLWLPPQKPAAPIRRVHVSNTL